MVSCNYSDKQIFGKSVTELLFNFTNCMEIFDQLHRPIVFTRPFQKIISLVPSQTELLFDLGLGNKIAGVTKFCVHPKNILETKTIVGGPKAVHFDVIRKLKPDIILCNKEENTKEIVNELSKEFTVHISDVNTIFDNYELIEQYGKLFDVSGKANEINQKIKLEISKFEKFISEKPSVRVAYFIWRKPWMVVGADTFINYMLELNKFENVYSDFSRYPQVELKELHQADYYLLSSEPFPFAEKHKLEVAEFYPMQKFCFVDGEFFSWYGSRLQKAFAYFREFRESIEK